MKRQPQLPLFSKGTRSFCLCIGCYLPLALVIVCGGTASVAIGQVVQLPSIETFSYSGTVLVPDSGSAYLGGIRRSASSYSRRGGSRAFGSALGNSQASVSATIIDHDEIDRQLLGATPQRFAHSRPVPWETNRADPIEEGKALVRYARAKYRQGQQSASFDGYRMAIAVLRGRLRQLATDEFRRTFGAAAEQALR